MKKIDVLDGGRGEGMGKGRVAKELRSESETKKTEERNLMRIKRMPIGKPLGEQERPKRKTEGADSLGKNPDLRPSADHRKEKSFNVQPSSKGGASFFEKEEGR